MISGVLAMLLAESALFGSARLFAWAAGFWLLNHVYFQLSEEPGLRRRFGDDYARYCAAVPRWVPRRTPWSPPDSPAAS
jgi:protein-S-isoprenylcysteine O-methyltransferase Ste14